MPSSPTPAVLRDTHLNGAEGRAAFNFYHQPLQYCLHSRGCACADGLSSPVLPSPSPPGMGGARHRGAQPSTKWRPPPPLRELRGTRGEGRPAAAPARRERRGRERTGAERGRHGGAGRGEGKRQRRDCRGWLCAGERCGGRGVRQQEGVTRRCPELCAHSRRGAGKSPRRGGLRRPLRALLRRGGRCPRLPNAGLHLRTTTGATHPLLHPISRSPKQLFSIIS